MSKHLERDLEALENEILAMSGLVEAMIGKACLALLSAARNIERIADHATNIAEDVNYLVEGDIARHQHGEMDVENNPDAPVRTSS